MAGLVVLATRGRGLRSGTEENNAKRQWNRRAKKSFQSFHRPLLISAQVIELKKRNMFADGGRLCCDLLRAIDTDMTLARAMQSRRRVSTEEILVLREKHAT